MHNRIQEQILHKAAKWDSCLLINLLIHQYANAGAHTYRRKGGRAKQGTAQISKENSIPTVFVTL